MVRSKSFIVLHDMPQVSIELFFEGVFLVFFEVVHPSLIAGTYYQNLIISMEVQKKTLIPALTFGSISLLIHLHYPYFRTIKLALGHLNSQQGSGSVVYQINIQ